MIQLRIVIVGMLMLFAVSVAAQDTPTLGYETYGDGEAKVLVLHDWIASADNWAPLTPYLDGDNYTYVFADVRGYGRSIDLSGEYTVEEVATDAFALADSLGWERFHVVGHSMNGLTVQYMALTDAASGDNRLQSVIMIAGVPAEGLRATEDDLAFLDASIDDAAVREQALLALTGERLTPTWARARAEQNLANSTSEARRGYFEMVTETDFAAELAEAEVQTPFLVIAGRNDLPSLSEDVYKETLGAWLPNVDIIVIESAGHYPMDETPVLLASLMEDFFAQQVA